MADRLYSTGEFASALREMYPELRDANADDATLTHAVLATHPQFKGKVVDTLEGAEGMRTLPGMAPAKITPPPSVDPDTFQTPAEAAAPMSRLANAKTGGRVPTTAGETKKTAQRQDQSYAAQAMTLPFSGVGKISQGLRDLISPPKRSVITGKTDPPVEPNYGPPPAAPPTVGSLQPAPELADAPVAPVNIRQRIEQATAALTPLPYGPSQVPVPEGGTAYPRVAAATKIAQGAMDLGMVAVPEALLTAPLATGAGLGVGIGADYATRAALQHTNLDPALQDAAAMGTGLAAGAAAGMVGHGTEARWASERANRAMVQQRLVDGIKADQDRANVDRVIQATQQDAKDAEPFQYLHTLQQHRQTYGAPPDLGAFMVDTANAVPEAAPYAGLLGPRKFYAPGEGGVADPTIDPASTLAAPTQPEYVRALGLSGEQALSPLAFDAQPAAAPAGLLGPRKFYAPPPAGDMHADPFDYLTDAVVTADGPMPALNGIPANQMLAPGLGLPDPLMDAFGDAASQALTTPDAPALVRPEGWEPQLSLTPPGMGVSDGVPAAGDLPLSGGPRRPKFGPPTDAVLPGGRPETVDQPRLALRDVVDQERDPRILSEVQSVLDELRVGPRPAFEDFAGDGSGPSANPRALFEAIARNGGLGNDPGMPGEIARLWEMGEGNLKTKRAGGAWKHLKGGDRFATDNGRRVRGALGGVKDVLHNTDVSANALENVGGPKALDQMAEALHGEPGFEHIDSPQALLDAIEQGLVDLRRQDASKGKRAEAADHPPIFWDLAKEGPSSIPARRSVEQGIAAFLAGKKNIWGARAYKVARQRLEAREGLEHYQQTRGPIEPPLSLGELPYNNLPDEPAGGLSSWLSDFLHDEEGSLKPEELKKGLRGLFERGAEEDQRLPGTEDMAPGTPTEMEAPFALTAETGPAATSHTQQGSLFGPPPEAPKSVRGEPTGPPSSRAFGGLFDDERGVLVLNVKPSNRRGLRDWLDRNEEQYGDQEWFQQARSAWEAGDTQTAWRVAALASSKSFSGAVAEGFNKEKARAAVETELGHALPKGIEVGEGGILKFPKNPGGLDVKFSDVTLGNQLANDLLQHVDPTSILRVTNDSGKVPSNLPHELRITAQMADQMLREWPDEALAELGLDRATMPPEKLAAQFDRAFSQAGKVLQLAKQWQDEHWDSLLHLDPSIGSTKGPGAAGRLEFFPAKTREAFLRWLEKATPEEQAEIGFTLPQGTTLDSPAGKTRAANFFRKAKALEELGTTFDRLTKESGAVEKATLWSALNKREQNSALLNALENTSRAFLISKPTTAIRNTWSQTLRYSVGVAEEMLAGAASTFLLDPAEAGIHFRRASELTKSALNSKNSVPIGLKKSFGAESLQALYDYTAETVQGMKPRDARRVLSVLDQFPKQTARFLGSLSLEENSPKIEADGAGAKGKVMAALNNPTFRNVVTIANRLQEYSFRTTVFDAMMREQIRTKGGDPMDLLGGDPNRLIKEYGAEEVERMIGSAVSASLDYTFAANPLPGTLQAKALDIFNNLGFMSPFLRMGMPFPRFNWVSAPRFLYDHSPAALLDIPGAVLGVGRLARGMELKAITTKLIPDLVQEVHRAKYERETSFQSFLSHQVEAAQARKTWKALEAKAEKQGSLGGMETEMQGLHDTVKDRLTKAAEARASYREAGTRVKRLEEQRKTAETKAEEYREIGAPSPAEYLARQAIGMGVMFPLAYMLRSSDGAKDTKWYEYRAKVPGAGDLTVDFRPFGPFVQYLLLADVAHDLMNATNWDEYHASRDKDAYLTTALADAYHGKYTSGTFGKEFVQAFLSISPAAGSTAAIMDYISGRTGTKTTLLDDVAGGMLGMLGQFLGRFTVPLQTVNDAAALFSDEEKKARIPEENTREGLNPGALVAGPTIANLPIARRSIQERTNPLTGMPTETELPNLRLGLGINGHTAGRLERELAHTGLEYGKAVPRKTGDREFDNHVAQQYGSLLSEYLPQLLDDEEYQGLTPEQQRDVLGPVLSDLRRAAFAAVAETLDDEAAAAKTVNPAQRAKQQRWAAYADQLTTEEGPPPAPAGETETMPSAATDAGFGPPPGTTGAGRFGPPPAAP